MGSPITFAYDFEHRGCSNYRRSDGYTPALNTKRFRTPRTIVSRATYFYELKRKFRKAKKQNMRKNRPFTNRP